MTAAIDATTVIGEGFVVPWPDQGDHWPGEPVDESPYTLGVLDCGHTVPYGDVYTLPDGPYREKHWCLDCWMQERAATLTQIRPHAWATPDGLEVVGGALDGWHVADAVCGWVLFSEYTPGLDAAAVLARYRAHAAGVSHA